MDLIQIYACLCDRTRLRLLNVLAQGPLCVCHFQAVLAEPQVKVSKHLAYLRTRGLVEVTRRGNWMVYALPVAAPRELRANLACLQDCTQDDPVFRQDLGRLRKLTPALAGRGPGCCGAEKRACGPARTSTARRPVA